MSKFKVGDRVKILAVTNEFMTHLIGTQGTLIRPIGDGIEVRCDQDGMPWAFDEDEIELVDSPTPPMHYEVWSGNVMYRRYSTEVEALAWAEGADSQNDMSPGYQVYKVTRELIKEICDD